MGLYTDPNYLEKKSSRIRRVLFHILAFLAACIAYMVVFSIVYFVMSVLGSIPLLRSLLFAPGDVFWSRIGLSPLVAGIAAAVVSEIISGTARPVMLFGTILYTASAILMIISRSISGSVIVQDGIAIAVFIWQFRVSPTLKDAKIAMMNRSKAE